MLTSHLVGTAHICVCHYNSLPCHTKPFLADRILSTVALMPQCCVCRLSPVCNVCIVAKRCVLEQKLLLRAYRKSYMRHRLVPKWMTLTFV